MPSCVDVRSSLYVMADITVKMYFGFNVISVLLTGAMIANRSFEPTSIGIKKNRFTKELSEKKTIFRKVDLKQKFEIYTFTAVFKIISFVLTAFVLCVVICDS